MSGVPDCINGLFELLGGFILATNVVRAYRDKRVAGVNWFSTAFFAAWGYWNLYYYPSLGQWASFGGGVLIVIVNTIWTCQLIYYTRRPGPPQSFA